MKMFGTVFFACCMFFLGFILLAGTPLGRIDRGCAPLTWVGRAITTVAALGSDGAEERMRASVAEMHQSCRFVLYRQFYAEELARQQALLNAVTAQAASKGRAAAAGRAP